MNREEAKALYESLTKKQQHCIFALKIAEWTTGVDFDYIRFVALIKKKEDPKRLVESLINDRLVEQLPNGRYRLDEGFYQALDEEDLNNFKSHPFQRHYEYYLMMKGFGKLSDNDRMQCDTAQARADNDDVVAF